MEYNKSSQMRRW